MLDCNNIYCVLIDLIEDYLTVNENNVSCNNEDLFYLLKYLIKDGCVNIPSDCENILRKYEVPTPYVNVKQIFNFPKNPFVDVIQIQ